MARARNIGNVYAELSVKDKMTHGIKKAEKGLASFGKKLASIGTGFALAAPAAAFAGLTASMKSAIDAGGKLSDMMSRTGAKDGEGLFIMQRAFENAGIAGEKVPDVINKMQRAIVEAGQGLTTYQRAFDSLGINFTELQKLDPAAQFQMISERIRLMQDPTAKAAAAMQIFGRSGAELLTLMNDGKAFEVAAKQVGGLGKTLADNANELDKVSDSMTQVGLKFQQVGAEVAVAMLPVLDKLTDALDEIDLSGVTQQAIEFAKVLGDAAGFAYDISKNLPGIKQARGAGGMIERGIAWAAGFNPEPGTALPTAGAWVGGNPFSDLYKPGMMTEGANERMLEKLPKLFEESVAIGIPDMLRALPEGISQIGASGVPGMDLMEEIIGGVIGKAWGNDEEMQNQDFARWQESSYQVNELQRRGLGYGGESVAQQAQKQVDILAQIRDVLRNAKLQEMQLVWS